MTTIAIKNGILAFDSKVTEDALFSGYMIKGKKTDKMAFAAAGDCEEVQAFLDWLSKGGGESNKRYFGLHEREVDLEGLALTEDGRIFSYGTRLYPYEIRAPFFAVGSGARLALGAMAKGASAEEAVKIAARLDGYTGGKVHTLSFKVRKK